MMALAAFAMAGCLAVHPGSDRIRAADLAPAYPAMAEVPGETIIAPAPAPGVARVFPAAELRMLAARFQLSAAAPQPLCVERPAGPLPPERLREAMQQSWPGARIEILEYSRRPAPGGEIEFPRAQLRRGPAGEMWNGFVRYAGNRRFAIWARVRVRIKVDRVMARADLHPGSAIAPQQLSVEPREEFPEPAPFPRSAEEVAGRVPRLLIPGGSALRWTQLEAPKDVLRGDTVIAQVQAGRASLRLEVQAQGPGAAGESILVRNPASGRKFRAQVVGRGLVSVNAAPRGADRAQGNP
jgi:flagella basal body P-ring formation protein FlgA